MPILISRAVTPHLSRQLAVHHTPSVCLQARCCHDAASPLSTSLTQPLSGLKADVGEGAPPMRARKYGFKALPVSPLMRMADAKKVRKHSVQLSDGLEEFHKEVAVNPFAQALATPIRFCSLTFARLPSHFLLPFTTTIESQSAGVKGQLPRVKARLQPGRSSDYDENTIAQTSYVVNRQDMVRHLSRKKHWTSLITDRQKAKVASIAHRSFNAQKLVQDHWTWDNQVDATAAMLERRIVAVMKAALRPSSTRQSSFSLESPQQLAFTLRFDCASLEDCRSAVRLEANGQAYDLSPLLSPEAIDTLTTELTQNLADTVYIAKSWEACQAQLAIERLKTYRASNEILKELPKVQNPAGSREAREAEKEKTMLFATDRADDGEQQ